MGAMNSEPHSEAESWYLRGNALRDSGDLAGALDAYRKCIKLNQQVAAPWIGLARILETNGQREEARQCLVHAVQAEPTMLMAHQLLAVAHQNRGDTDAALAAYQRAIGLDERNTDSYVGLGRLYEDVGDAERAADAYRRALSLNSQQVDALSLLLGLSKFVDVRAECNQASLLLEKLAPREAALLGYGLGNALQTSGDFDAAFSAFARANQARQSMAPAFNSDEFHARIDALINIFSSDFFRSRAGWGQADDRPVFVVGLPRSGTTLTEQIIASHPRCFGAGELDTLTDLATGAPDLLCDPDTYWPLCAPQLSRANVGDIAQSYLNIVGGKAQTDAVRIADKQPLNFWHLGLIALALPRARIIHCIRDIRDCGLSIFTHNFHPSQNWSTQLENIVQYWTGYRRLMAHWQSVTHLSIMDVSYEETVADLEGQARRLLKFLDVKWDSRVLDFYKHNRAVQTPSRWQVRQPVYRTSRSRWRNYEPYLNPLLAAVIE